MLHTLPPSLISMHSKQLLHFEKYKKIMEVPATFCSYFSKVSNGEKFPLFFKFWSRDTSGSFERICILSTPSCPARQPPPIFFSSPYCVLYCVLCILHAKTPLLCMRATLCMLIRSALDQVGRAKQMHENKQ